MKKYKLYDEVDYYGYKVRIIGFHNHEGGQCIVEGYPHGHSGFRSEYWHDENGKVLPFVASDKNDRWYVPFDSLSPIKNIDLGLENIF